jgi:hypothetical protein
VALQGSIAGEGSYDEGVSNFRSQSRQTLQTGSLALIGSTPRGRRIGENIAMLQMCRALGFTISVDPQDPGLVRVSKVLQPQEAPAG